MKVVMGTTGTIGSTMKSAQLARLAGVSTDALRHYERVGVLPAPQRTAGNYRVYPAGALDRVRLIRRALSFGFSLAELARIFKVRERGGIPCREARELGMAKLADVERRLAELASLRVQLKKVLRDWDNRLTQASSTERARLLESLPESAVSMTSGKISLKRGHRKL
jgi:DNA-binding transcriptional MerR regulator